MELDCVPVLWLQSVLLLQRLMGWGVGGIVKEMVVGTFAEKDMPVHWPFSTLSP